MKDHCTPTARWLDAVELGIMFQGEDLFIWEATAYIMLLPDTDLIRAEVGIFGVTGDKTNLQTELLGGTRRAMEKAGFIDPNTAPADEPGIALELLKLVWSKLFTEITVQMAERNQREAAKAKTMSR